MTRLDAVLGDLDDASAARVAPALTWLQARGARDGAPDASLVQEFLVRELPSVAGGERETHEVAWALGDLFARAGLPALADLCRAPATHETLAVWRWTRSFGEVPAEFWTPALRALTVRAEVPPRATLSVSSARALLEVVGSDGLTLTADGQLPLATVLALDDRFRWSEEFPWLRRSQEADVAPLRLLRDHLEAQRLLARDRDRLVRTALGVACAGSTARLWRTLVDPSPRWTREFERDALGAMAASVLRSADFTLGRVAEEMTHVLAGKWRPAGPRGTAGRSGLYDGASGVAQAWYQLGVPLGWWDTGNGLADRRPNAFGRAAAATVFRAVAGPRQEAVRRAASANTRW